MKEEQKELIINFFDTYLESFFQKRLDQSPTEYKIFTVGIIKKVAEEKSKKLLNDFLIKIYSDNKSDKYNQDIQKIIDCWYEIHDILNGSWSNTNATNLYKYVNDKRFFGKEDVSKLDICKFLKELTISFLKKYVRDNNIAINSSPLNAEYYKAAANGDFAFLSKNVPASQNINKKDQLFSNTLLHYALSSVGIVSNGDSFNKALDSVKCVKLLLDRGASLSLTNNCNERPLNMFVRMLPIHEKDCPLNVITTCMITSIIYCIQTGEELPSNFFETLNKKGYKSIANKISIELEDIDRNSKFVHSLKSSSIEISSL